MKADNEFDGIGKKTTYKVPDGFFEHISERTLSKAKQRELKRRKTLMLWRTVAVAASLSAIAILGYYMYETEKPEIQMIVQSKNPDIKQTISQENNVEELTTVLADMSDDELAQLEAMFKADPFMEE